MNDYYVYAHIRNDNDTYIYIGKGKNDRAYYKPRNGKHDKIMNEVGMHVVILYEGLTEEQQRDQRIVLDFKDGIYDEDLMRWFRQNIRKITEGDEYFWTICFLPCSSDEEQQKRFEKLAQC